MTGHSQDLLIFAIVVGSRFLVPLAIPRFPLPAMIIAMIIDAADQTIFQTTTDLDLTNYQSYDKALDVYYLSIAYVATMRNWTNLPAFEVSRFLYYYRMVGVVLFESFHIRALLLIFPNTFEYFFDFYEGVRTRWNPRRLSKRHVIYAAAFIWIFIKLPQEWWIHVAQLDTTEFIKEDIFNVPVDTDWLTIVKDFPWAFVALGAVIVGLIFGARWIMRNKLPAPDWSWTFDADAHPGTDPINQARIDNRTPASKIFDRNLVEKIALLSLICIIFAKMLPNVNASDLEVVIGVGALITLNTAVSEWLTRRGTTFESSIQQFAATAAINFGLVLVAHWILDRGTGSINVGATLFFVLLISLIVSMYDRYRPIYLTRFGGSA